MKKIFSTLSVAASLCILTSSGLYANDFNADGKGDILWERANGKHQLWLMNDGVVTSQVAIDQPDWTVRSTDDFNGDGKADILWQRANGKHQLFLMNDGEYVSEVAIGQPDWTVVGTDDFNGDGKADILWQRANGKHQLWLMNDGVVTSQVAIDQPDWTVRSTDDFNGDGKADILWQRANGKHQLFLMNDGEYVSEVAIGQPDWTVVGTDDFNGDGKADILWRRANGKKHIWLMEDGVMTSEVAVDQIDWCVQSTDDYNGDGKADILWKRANGKHHIWLMADGVMTSEVAVDQPDWTVQPAVECPETPNPIQPQPPTAEILGTKLACGGEDLTESLDAADYNMTQTKKRNVSSNGTDDANRQMPTAQNSLEQMGMLVPARTANGELIDDGGEVYPLVVSYVQQVFGPYEVSDGDADIGDPNTADAVFVALSLNDGENWKNFTVADHTDKSSFDASWGENLVAYPGHASKPNIAIEGNNILVAWSSKYCKGNPMKLPLSEDADNPYPTDYFAVNGKQGSIDYQVLAPNGKFVEEVPFSCVWTARGIFIPEDGNITWHAPKQLTSGARDTNHIWIEADEVGFAMVWQEDPEGMHAGDGDGPGAGWSGATANHGSDIWYAELEMGKFADVNDTDDETSKPKSKYNFTYPVRITDNEKCADPATSNKEKKPYCKYLCETYGSVEIEKGNQSGDTVFRCLTYDTDMLEDVQVYLNGDTGASRPAIKILTTDIGEKVVILGYEETKGLSVDETPDDETNIELEGKVVYFESFLYGAVNDFNESKADTIQDVAMPLISAGNSVSIKVPQENNVTNFIYENARRLVIGTQIDACDAEKFTFAFLYKQSFDTKGASSDMFVRVNNGFTYDSFVELEGRTVSNVSAQDNRTIENIVDYNVSWNAADLDAMTYDNKLENTFSPRIFLRGNDIYVGFEYTPNYAKTSQDNMPNNFHNNIFKDGIVDENGTAWRGPQNVTEIVKGGETSVDARFFSTPRGVNDGGLESDQSNPNVIFCSWGTLEKNDPGVPDAGRSEGGIYGKRSTDDGLTWSPRFIVAAKDKTVIHEKEVSSFATADGKKIYNVWLQEQDDFNASDPDSGLDSWFGLIDFNISIVPE